MTGLDISAPMLEYCRAHTPPGLKVDFVQADATVYPFPPASADLLFSRFGVMFFAEPATSFTNMREAIKPGGRVVFAAGVSHAPWLDAPLQAVYQHVPKMRNRQKIPPCLASESAVRRRRRRRIFRHRGEAARSAMRSKLGRGSRRRQRHAFGPASRALEGPDNAGGDEPGA